LLADPQVAGASLDIVFDVVNLHARLSGAQAAGAIARGLASGPAGDIAEKALAGGDVTWGDNLTGQHVAVAAAARAVAAASMAVATASDSDGEAPEWVGRAESLVKLAARIAPALPIASATRKYLGAARAVARQDAGEEADVAAVHAVSRLLWNAGRTELAVRIARDALQTTGDPLAGGPQITSVEAFVRRLGLDGAMRAGLEAVVAMGAAADRNLPEAASIAESALQHAQAVDWSELALAERAESRALIAIAPARAKRSELAAGELKLVSADAVMLARRGETAPFGSLCQALVEVLPADDANAEWAKWLAATGEAGASEALTLIAQYVRWSTELDVSGVAADLETGELRRRA
jgi:hypothetical protein